MSAWMEDRPTPADEARRLYEEAEARTARAMEELVGRDAFGEVLARVTENVLALAKIGSDAADLVVRNLRLAGRRDVTSLARQLARTEDKLERVLQEVERLRDAVDAAARDGRPGRRRRACGAGSPRAPTGAAPPIRPRPAAATPASTRPARTATTSRRSASGKAGGGSARKGAEPKS